MKSRKIKSRTQHRNKILDYFFLIGLKIQNYQVRIRILHRHICHFGLLLFYHCVNIDSTSRSVYIALIIIIEKDEERKLNLCDA